VISIAGGETTYSPAQSSRILASAGIPGFSSWLGLSNATLTAKTSLTRSSWVWMFFGVNSASELTKVTVR
jgi:hypothetical protein